VDVCPICEGALIDVPQELPNGHIRHACPNCGTYDISDFVSDVKPVLRSDRVPRAVLSHSLRKMQRIGTPVLTDQMLTKILAGKLPSVVEQCDNLIRWFGENLSAPGDRVWIESASHRAIAGSATDAGFDQILAYLLERKLLDSEINARGRSMKAHVTLTVDGWRHYEALLKNRPLSKIAFMAMQYGNRELENLFLTVLKPAVAKTGFDLCKLNENPRAGLIDDRLRVEIRNSRFLVADLSHDNDGAYWEAGFAEGLGKPVIYICEETKFKKNSTHFDTNHHHTIIWNLISPNEAAQDLKATIRATLPHEAKMTDD